VSRYNHYGEARDGCDAFKRPEAAKSEAGQAVSGFSQVSDVCRVKTCPLYDSAKNLACCKVASMRAVFQGKELCEKAEMVNGGVLCIEDEMRLER